MTNQLPQLKNNVEIVGTLKEINLEAAVSKNGSNKKYIKGTVTVTSNHDGKVHEHKVSVFQMEKSKKGDVIKAYKGLQTLMAEAKSIEDFGVENADRIRVSGEVDIEQYFNKQAEFVEFNKIKGSFFTRLDEKTDQPDKAIATVEVVVKGFSPVADTETGEILHHAVNAFTIGYGERIVELKKAIVTDALVGPMENLYAPGTTGALNFKLNNYVEKVEKEAVQEVTMSHGFGSEEAVEGNRVFDKFVNNLEITGGSIPFEEPKALSVEQIEEAARKLALKVEELRATAQGQSSSNTQAPPAGFGTGFGDINSQMPGNLTGPKPTLPPVSTPAPITPPPADIADEEMPDF